MQIVIILSHLRNNGSMVPSLIPSPEENKRQRFKIHMHTYIHIHIYTHMHMHIVIFLSTLPSLNNVLWNFLFQQKQQNSQIPSFKWVNHITKHLYLCLY